MSNEILDDRFVNEEKRKRIQILNWISIIILWGGIGYCGINGLLSEIKVIAAIILLILSTGIMYYNYELGVRLTLGVILIGTINLVDFFPLKYFISFGINAIEIGFEFLLFGIGIIHYFTNREELSKFLKDLFYMPILSYLVLVVLKFLVILKNMHNMVEGDHTIQYDIGIFEKLQFIIIGIGIISIFGSIINTSYKSKKSIFLITVWVTIILLKISIKWI